MKPEIKVIRTDSHGNKNGLNQLITVKETATILDCTEQTVRAMVRRKELPAVKIGRRVYIQRDKFIAKFCE